MGKIIDIGLPPRDHPMFTGGVEMFSTPRSGLSFENTPKSTDGETLAKPNKAPKTRKSRKR